MKHDIAIAALLATSKAVSASPHLRFVGVDADINTDTESECQSLSVEYPNSIPWVSYQGYDYIFSRELYNSACVDSQGRQFEYGKIAGVYGGGGCSNACVLGTSVDQARGCNQRPPSNMLVGFEYNCEQNTCYCLYEAGTLGNQYSQCFNGMNTKNKGTGEVTRTVPQQGETCYSLQIQSTATPFPSPSPPGSSICTYTPDYSCYSNGRPACCSVNNGAGCPNYLTMCDNHAEGTTGYNYCTNAPNYNCYTDGQPSCCFATGGAFMNCPQTEPPCDVQKIGSYCTGTPNWQCYPKTGYPGCCSKKNGQNCPTSYQDAQAKYPCSNEDVIAEEEDESTISEEFNLRGVDSATDSVLILKRNNKIVGSSICTYPPDYSCYSNGRPACCSVKKGAGCPNYLTMCDNHAEGTTGYNYCTNAPNYNCYTDGQPSCCFATGGAFMNCPQTEPPCDVQKIGSYCTGTPNWQCYPKTGYPGCCSKKNGQNCPSSYEDAQAKYPCSNEDVIVEDERE